MSRATYPVWSKVLQERGCKIGVELGVEFGGNAEHMLKHAAIDKLYGVDPYYRPGGARERDQSPWKDELYHNMLAKLAPYGQRYQHIRKFAEDAVNDVPSELDFIYVDHNHSCGGMRIFFRDWMPKLKIEGIVGGDGYYDNVKLIVDEVCVLHDWVVVEEKHSVFWLVKTGYVWRPH